MTNQPPKVAPNFFDGYTANGSSMSASAYTVADKFVLTVICRRCHTPISAADINLARALMFVVDDHRRHRCK